MAWRRADSGGICEGNDRSSQGSKSFSCSHVTYVHEMSRNCLEAPKKRGKGLLTGLAEYANLGALRLAGGVGRTRWRRFLAARRLPCELGRQHLGRHTFLQLVRVRLPGWARYTKRSGWKRRMSGVD